MRRRDFLRALVGLPVAAAAAPLLALVPEATPALEIDALFRQAYAGAIPYVYGHGLSGFITGITAPKTARGYMMAKEQAIGRLAQEYQRANDFLFWDGNIWQAPLMLDPICPPGRLYLRREVDLWKT